MSWIAAGVASASLAVSGYQYYDNKKQAKKDAANRPKLDMSAQKNYADQVSRQGVPEEVKGQYKSDLQRSAAYSLGQIGTRKGGLTGVSTANENLNKGYQNMMSADAQALMGNQRYGQELMANAQGQEFEINQLNPYNIGTARDSANRGARNQNINNSIQAGGSVYMYGQRTKAMKGIPAQYTINPQSQVGMQNYSGSANSIEYNPYGNMDYSGQKYNQNPWG